MYIYIYRERPPSCPLICVSPRPPPWASLSAHPLPSPTVLDLHPPLCPTPFPPLTYLRAEALSCTPIPRLVCGGCSSATRVPLPTLPPRGPTLGFYTILPLPIWYVD